MGKIVLTEGRGRPVRPRMLMLTRLIPSNVRFGKGISRISQSVGNISVVTALVTVLDGFLILAGHSIIPGTRTPFS